MNIVKLTPEQLIAATLLLNLKCRDTGGTIEVFEVCKIHNWGQTNEVICYGHYEFDEFERRFTFTPHDGMNLHFLNEKKYAPEESYDLFRATPAKLNKDELKELKRHI